MIDFFKQLKKQNPAYDLPFFLYMNSAVSNLNAIFLNLKCPNRSVQMKAYMRNQFDFFGIAAANRKEEVKKWRATLGEIDFKEKESMVKEMWVSPNREMQLAAIDWMLSWKKTEYTEEYIQLFEYLIINKSWWDTIDSIASNLIGNYAKKFSVQFDRILKRWKSSNNFWLNRVCLIYQLKFKENTNLIVLSECIAKFKKNKEFFIQKAIGWSLREVSKRNPDWVINEVKTQEIQGLAKREALRLLKGQ